MLHFINAGVNMSARGSDIANHHIADISTRKHRERVEEHHVIWQKVCRFKTTTQVSHPLVPHRDNFLLCYLFSLAYTLIVNRIDICENGRVFPSFAAKVFNKDSQVESKVSEHFNKVIDSLWKIMHNFFSPEDENAPLHFRQSLSRVFWDARGKMHSKNRSHSLKRYAVALLQENLSPHTFVRRCGFIAKNIHTMFDYFFNSDKQDVTCALTLAGWVHSVNGKVQGGISPDFSGIKTATEKLAPFARALFRE